MVLQQPDDRGDRLLLRVGEHLPPRLEFVGVLDRP
jgi:hypothetical protein